ncbi:MAG: flavodoxin domain-containing protein [Lachnospiraceae bacterium]|nr:flavodoxin domain-containing protein [Lachnospiraceae bacterium]
MSKVAVVFWSGTGNTAAMADAVVEGAKAAGADVDLLQAGEFSSSKAGEYSGIAFGCPAMGDEVLEEAEFQPMWDDVKGSLGGKKVALFGSWGWGNGVWMDSWKEDAEGSGVSLVTDPVICCNGPDDATLQDLRTLGGAVA